MFSSGMVGVAISAAAQALLLDGAAAKEERGKM